MRHEPWEGIAGLIAQDKSLAIQLRDCILSFLSCLSPCYVPPKKKRLINYYYRTIEMTSPLPGPMPCITIISRQYTCNLQTTHIYLEGVMFFWVCITCLCFSDFRIGPCTRVLFGTVSPLLEAAKRSRSSAQLGNNPQSLWLYIA